MASEYRRGRARARWTARDLARVVEAVVASAPDALWSAEDVRERLAFGREGAGPAASSVREAIRELERRRRITRVEVWGRQGWGTTRFAYRARRARGLAVAA